MSIWGIYIQYGLSSYIRGLEINIVLIENVTLNEK